MFLLVSNAILCGAFIVLSGRRAMWILPALFFLTLLLVQSLRLLRKSRTDPLTGLYNLRHLEAMYSRYRRCPAMTVYYFDLDHLKQVNDSQGHSAGDRLLADFASCLREMARGHDRAFRIGGDEFLLILPDQRDSIIPNSVFSVSWGCASGQGKDLGDLIRNAERQMYQKRNRTTIS